MSNYTPNRFMGLKIHSLKSLDLNKDFELLSAQMLRDLSATHLVEIIDLINRLETELND